MVDFLVAFTPLLALKPSVAMYSTCFTIRQSATRYPGLLYEIISLLAFLSTARGTWIQHRYGRRLCGICPESGESYDASGATCFHNDPFNATLALFGISVDCKLRYAPLFFAMGGHVPPRPCLDNRLGIDGLHVFVAVALRCIGCLSASRNTAAYQALRGRNGSISGVLRRILEEWRALTIGLMILAE